MSAPSLPLLLLTASLLTPQGYLLSIFLTLPVNTANAAGGLCGQKCSGLPPLPNAQCGADPCLPVFTQLSVFPPSTLSSLESTYIDGTKGTRLAAVHSAGIPAGADRAGEVGVQLLVLLHAVALRAVVPGGARGKGGACVRRARMCVMRG